MKKFKPCKVDFIAAGAIILLVFVAYNFSVTIYNIFADPPEEQEVAEETEKDEDKGEDSFVIAMDPYLDYLTIVNQDHRYEFGGAYDKALQDDLIYVSDCYGVPTLVEKAAYLAFGMLKQDLHQQGFEIELFSAYRTEEDQQWVLDHFGNLEGWSETNTVAEPGYSEHHTGLMIEYVVWWPDETTKTYDLTWYTETAERQAQNPEFKTIRKTLADYGFIERYPRGKEEITGVKCAPYELRFVGSSEVAHQIMDNDLCLEEYLEPKDE